MSTLSQFTGGAPTRAIVNGFSSGGVVSSASVAAALNTNGAREVLSGALTANTLATVVNITTGGQISYLSGHTKDATSRTVRLVVILDGTTVFDATSSTASLLGAGLVAVGHQPSGTGGWVEGAPIRFNSSCVIRLASSLTETDKLAVSYKLS